MDKLNIIDDIINSIAFNLNKNFGDSFFIYNKSIVQNFKTPSFSIINTNYSIEAKLNNRFYCSTKFIVKCIGKEFDINIYNKLFVALNILNVAGGDVEISNVYFDSSDNIFNFYFECNFFVIVDKCIDKMGDLSCFFK